MLGGDPDRLQAIKADHDWYWHTFFLPFGQGYANCLIGDVDEVSRQIEDAQKRLGFTEMWLQFGQGHLDPEENEEMLHTFAEKILSAMRAGFGGHREPAQSAAKPKA